MTFKCCLSERAQSWSVFLVLFPLFSLIVILSRHNYSKFQYVSGVSDPSPPNTPTSDASSSLVSQKFYDCSIYINALEDIMHAGIQCFPFFFPHRIELVQTLTTQPYNFLKTTQVEITQRLSEERQEGMRSIPALNAMCRTSLKKAEPLLLLLILFSSFKCSTVKEFLGLQHYL